MDIGLRMLDEMAAFNEVANKLYVDFDSGKVYWTDSFRSGKEAGYERGTGANRRHMFSYKGTRYLTHRFIYWAKHKRVVPVIDHINGNPLDNRIENLRECDRSENQFNCKLDKRNKYGVKGVHWDKRGERYRFQIQVRGEKHYAYDKDFFEICCKAFSMRNRLHGKFARHG